MKHRAAATLLLLSFFLASSARPSPMSLQRPLIETSSDSTSIANELEQIIDASPLLSFHRDIVTIQSITGDEANVGEFIIQFLQERNFYVEKQVVPAPAPVDAAELGAGEQSADKGSPSDDAESDENVNDNASSKERFNIYAYPASSPPPEILLTSHIDTVPPFIPYSLSAPTRRDNDGDGNSESHLDRDKILISGRGSVDAKASVAAQIFAVLEHLRVHPETRLGLLFVVGEETGGDGMKWFSNSSLNASPPTYHTVIFGEPTELALVSGHKGMLSFKIIANGKAAHSGYPWLGHSAVSALLPAASRVDQLGDIPVEEGGLPSSEKFGKTTLNIGRLSGGVAFNIVPASAYADVAVRLAAGTVKEAKNIIRTAVRDAAAKNGEERNVIVEFPAGANAYPPQEIDADINGFTVTTMNYGTDVPNLRIPEGGAGNGSSRVKRYLYGPGSIFVAHGDHEGLRVRELEEAVKGYRKLIEASLEGRGGVQE